MAIVGCGALGSFQAGALARAGVRPLTILDRDYVEPSNLQRQWLFDEADAAEALPKAVAAERSLAPHQFGRPRDRHRRRSDSVKYRGAVGRAALILDGTDNFETRYLINDYSVSRGTPWIYGAAVGSYGVTMPVMPGHSACFRCVYPEPPGGNPADL